jgi:hypothetical protein
MKKISEHYLFVINALLIAGLIGIGFWIQQSNTIITPTSPAISNTQIVSAASITASATLAVGQNIPTTAPTSTIVSPKKAATTAPTIRRPRENESGERYYDE